MTNGFQPGPDHVYLPYLPVTASRFHEVSWLVATQTMIKIYDK